jgi:pre-mRNA-processing factor 6
MLQERQEAVIAKCEAAAPHHGPVWQAVAKDLGNGGLSTREILGLVADRLE